MGVGGRRFGGSGAGLGLMDLRMFHKPCLLQVELLNLKWDRGKSCPCRVAWKALDGPERRHNGEAKMFCARACALNPKPKTRALSFSWADATIARCGCSGPQQVFRMHSARYISSSRMEWFPCIPYALLKLHSVNATSGCSSPYCCCLIFRLRASSSCWRW